MRWKVEVLRTAQRDWASRTWRRRQIVSISFWGSWAVFSTSMKDDRVLTGVSLLGALEGCCCGVGGGGGWKGIVSEAFWGEGGCCSLRGALTPGTIVSLRSCWILSAYAVRSSSASFKPFSFAFWSNFSLYRSWMCLGFWCAA